MRRGYNFALSKKKKKKCLTSLNYIRAIYIHKYIKSMRDTRSQILLNGLGGRGLVCRERGTGWVRLSCGSMFMWVENLRAVQLLLLGRLVVGLRSGDHLGMLRQLSLSCALWGDPGLVDIVKLIGEVSGHGPELEELEQ